MQCKDRDEVKAWFINHGWSEDRYGALRQEINGKKFRLVFKIVAFSLQEPNPWRVCCSDSRWLVTKTFYYSKNTSKIMSDILNGKYTR